MFLSEQLTANGGSGSPSTLGRIVASKAVFDFITNDSISDVTYGSAGTGYVVGESFDILTALSPEAIFVARGVVVAESGGVPSEVKLVSGGSIPGIASVGSPFDTPITGLATANASAGGDDGLLVDVVPEQAHWVEDRGFGAQSPLPSTDFVDTSTNFEWIATSLKASNPATIGMKTGFSTGGFARLMVATGFDKGSTWDGQPGRSPTAGNGEPLQLMPSNNPQVYISSNERRVNIIVRDGAFSHYSTIGFFIPYTNTEANYPFPGFCAGTTVGGLAFNTSRGSLSSNPGSVAAGMVFPFAIQNGTSNQCPYQYRDNLSPQWFTICEATSEQVNLVAQMWPAQGSFNEYDFTHAPEVNGFDTNPQGADQASGIFSDMLSNNGWFESANGGGHGVPGIAPLGLQNRASIVVTPHIIKNQPEDVQAIGILDGFEAVHGRGLTAFEEIVQFNGKRYIVFNDVNTADLYRWVAMEIV